MRICEVEECASHTDGYHRWCAKHWSRVRRTGSPHLMVRQPKPRGVPRVYSTSEKGGYVYEKGLDWHPMRSPTASQMLQHRRVYYESVDGELFPCYWCGKALESWEKTVIDHVDEDGLNNTPSNLVAACRACNTQRSQAIGMLKRCRPEVREQLRVMLDEAATSGSICS